MSTKVTITITFDEQQREYVRSAMQKYGAGWTDLVSASLDPNNLNTAIFVFNVPGPEDSIDEIHRRDRPEPRG